MPRQRRVAHVLYCLVYSGFQNGVVNIINRLPERKFAHALIALTDSTDLQDRLRHEIEVVHILKPLRNNPGYPLNVFDVLRMCRFEIMHTYNLPWLEILLAGFTAGVAGRIHREHGWDILGLDRTARRYKWLRRVMQFVVDRYIVLSHRVQHYLAVIVGIPATRLINIANDIDTERIMPARDCQGAGAFVVVKVGYSAGIAVRLRYCADHLDVLARHDRAAPERAFREFSLHGMVDNRLCVYRAIARDTGYPGITA